MLKQRADLLALEKGGKLRDNWNGEDMRFIRYP